MKSYFAKLAARATLANAPPPPSTTKPTLDPFENVSATDIPTPSISVSSRPVDRLLETDRSEPPGKTIKSLSEQSDAGVRIESEILAPRPTPQVLRADDVQSVSHNTAEAESHRSKTETQPQSPRLEREERIAFQPAQEESTPQARNLNRSGRK